MKTIRYWLKKPFVIVIAAVGVSISLWIIVLSHIVSRSESVDTVVPTVIHRECPPGYSLQTDGQGHYALRFDYAGGVVIHSYYGEWMTREQCLEIAWDGYDSHQAAEKQYRERNKQLNADWKDVNP